VEYLKLYTLLKSIDQAAYTGREEYRKHVTLTVTLDKKTLDIDIPVLVEYFKKTKEFVNLINSWVE
jgi:uncharacterized alkaline shock family protein YloU